MYCKTKLDTPLAASYTMQDLTLREIDTIQNGWRGERQALTSPARSLAREEPNLTG